MRRCRPLLGTLVAIQAPDQASIEAGFAVVRKIHDLMSAHQADSDVGKINRRAHIEAVRVSELTLAVLERAIDWSRRSNGTFDVVRAGGRAIKSGEIPFLAGQSEPDPLASWQDLRIRSNGVSLKRPASVDLGGIAKGFAVDEAVDAMRRAGAAWGLINAGGDLRGFGDRSWEINVADPRTREPRVLIELTDRALATSAGRSEEGGVLNFNHLPQRASRWASATAEAANCCDADVLTKIIMASSPNAAQLLAEADARAFGIDCAGRVSDLDSASV